MKYYDASHPMVVKQSGDPARGEWKPWAREDRPKGKRRGKRRAQTPRG